MELRTQTAALCLMVAAATAATGQNFESRAAHRHLFGSCQGILRVTSAGAAFEESVRKPGKTPKHRMSWGWNEIQQFDLYRARIDILGYHDRPWLADTDQSFRFDLTAGADVMPLYGRLSETRDQRFVAHLNLSPQDEHWSVAARRLRFPGDVEGAIVVEPSRVLFRAQKQDDSRVWRDLDIRDISSDGPFSLTIDTLEQGGPFVFQLKQQLDSKLYEQLWMRLNRPKGLSLISQENSK